MTMHVNIGGAWKQAKEVWVNIGGVWKKTKEVHTNIGGAWKKGYSGAVILQQGAKLNDFDSIIQKNSDHVLVRVGVYNSGVPAYNTLETSEAIDSAGYNQIVVDMAHIATNSVWHSSRINWGPFSTSATYTPSTVESRITATLTMANPGVYKIEIQPNIHSDNGQQLHSVTIKVYSIKLRNTVNSAEKFVWDINQQP
ncbi:hypothetical protein [Cohnella herbarum]|uniref:Uncharacterized protein n=1 Tax=Cohnella herbarum TaxID=2728023 RepID=A0A7Z2ZQ70_9BACL|nr:hypothetical protein [Cohnella herbarum]QJD86722.1 hypothetical protein HH215_28500 [Cohnella herbarum]